MLNVTRRRPPNYARLFFRVIEYIFIFNRKIWHLRVTETTKWLTSVYRLNDESRNTVCAKNDIIFDLKGLEISQSRKSAGFCSIRLLQILLCLTVNHLLFLNGLKTKLQLKLFKEAVQEITQNRSIFIVMILSALLFKAILVAVLGFLDNWHADACSGWCESTFILIRCQE